MTKPAARPGDLMAFLHRAMIDASSACILWPYGTRGAGYPAMSIKKRGKGAHAVMCEMAHGPAPNGKMHAAHSCNNRLCVNPNHLRWATAKSNAADKKLHGTNNDGEAHGLAVLTNEQAKYIRYAVAQGIKQRRLAEELGVAPMVVSRVVRNVSYKTGAI